MKLSVVILNYNVSCFLELCIKSVQLAIQSIDAEIIVVDNNSQDNSCTMVKQKFQNVLLIENDQNVGFSKGNNIGVAQSKGEYICILNPDTVVAEDTFAKLIEFANAQKKLGVVGCKLINGAGRFLPESKRNVPFIKVALKKLLGNSSEYYANHLKENDTGKVDVLVGAFMLLKRDVYDKFNGFDEDYFMYGEDIDLSYRILKSGLSNYYFGSTTVLHFKGESTLKDKLYLKRFYGAMQIFYKKHFKKNIIFDVLVWLGIQIAYVFIKKDVTPIIEANCYVIISDSKNENLKKALIKPVSIINNITIKVENNTEIIFDSNYMSFKEIISNMNNDESNQSVTYKILPKNSNYIIGSNDTLSRGEIIKF